jgi:hypothetical protein
MPYSVAAQASPPLSVIICPMRSWRYILIGVVFLLAYYGVIFWYARQARAEALDHVAYRFALENPGDLCADPLSDGTVICSAEGQLYFVRPDGTEQARYDATQGAQFDAYGNPGYAWAGGGGGDLLIVSYTERLTSQPAEVVALDSRGQEVWSHTLPRGTALGWIGHSDKYVYLLRTDGTLQQHGLDGKLNWSKPAQAVGDGGMVTARDGWVYLTSNQQGCIIALDTSGTEAWRFVHRNYLPDYPVVGADGTLYFITGSGGLQAVGRDGKAKWTCAPKLPQTPTSAPFSIRDLMGSGTNYGYYGGYSGYGYAHVAVARDRILFLYNDHLIACDLSGKQLWATALTQGVPLSLVATADGASCVAVEGRGVLGFDRDGRQRWDNRSIRQFSSALSIGTDGRAYVETMDALYAFELE